MKLCNALWISVLVVCYAFLAGGAIFRDYRRKSYNLAKAKVKPDALLSTTTPAPETRFHPTSSRCCQIGERAARKKKMCDVTHLAVVRKYNYERRKNSKRMSNRTKKRFRRKRLGKLSEKISKCSATYPKYFMKCCSYKQEFYKHMKKCRQKPRRYRSRCRQIIKKRYS